MSRYLIDRIEASPNIALTHHTRITRLHGDPSSGLEGVTWQNDRTGAEEEKASRHVFLFVGAEPETRWLDGCGIHVDQSGFVITGNASHAAASERPPTPLESSVAGVFAVGDVRSGSVKRVGGAIGEGASAVAQIHRYLAPGSP
jgi:thioredoxin reductase (NADPH)